MLSSIRKETRQVRPRFVSKSSLLVLVLLFLLPVSASSQPQQIVQLLSDDPDWGCILTSEGSEVTYKGSLGRSLSASPALAARKLNQQRARFQRTVSRLKSLGKLSKKSKKKLRTVRQQLKKRTALLKAVKRCKNGELELSATSSAQVSFAFYCQHGFNVRSVADGDNSCGIDLRSLQDLKNEISSGTRAFTLQGALRVIHDNLGDKCRSQGGTYLTPEMPELFFPLYHGYCSTEEELPMTFSVGRMPIVLGMETVNEDCLIGRQPTTGEKDPCDCYDPDDSGGGGGSSGGGGGGSKQPPSDEDCFVSRMETVNEDC